MATDKLSDFKLGMGVVIKGNKPGLARHHGRPQVAVPRFLVRSRLTETGHLQPALSTPKCEFSVFRAQRTCLVIANVDLPRWEELARAALAKSLSFEGPLRGGKREEKEKEGKTQKGREKTPP